MGDSPNLESELNASFRGHRDWEEWSRKYVWKNANEIPEDAERAGLRREKFNYRGISVRAGLRDLVASNVDQPFLEEIGELGDLERLDLEWPLVAIDLTPLLGLKRLRHLAIDSPRKISDFRQLLKLPALTTLMLTAAKLMTDIEWLRDAHHLEVIGVEGGMWSPQKIPSLKPLAGLRSLRAFLGTSIQLAEKELMPLAECPQLEFIGMAAAAPRSEFERLHAARPDIICTWFRPEPWQAIGRR